MSDKPDPPPVLVEVIRLSRGKPKTLFEQLYAQSDARLIANGGKLVPLTDDDFADPPPDLIRILQSQRGTK